MSAKQKTEAKSAATAENASAKKQPMMVPALMGTAMIAGVAIGMVSTNNSSSSSQGDMDGQIEAYIRANPGLIIEILTAHNVERANQERLQAVNLVKLDDGKTILGNPDGDITIYEFSDYNCGYCKRAFNDVQTLIASDDNIRVVIKEFPILSESSKTAAELSMAAAELGKYEEIHSALMAWQGRLDDAVLDQVIKDIGLDRAELDAIIAKGEIAEQIAATRQAAQAIQISGTPGFVIGDTVVPGAISAQQMAEIVAEERAKSQ